MALNEGRTVSNSRVTRGDGMLERFLAQRRARMADRLIPPGHRAGRILDIGCGRYPFFLSTTDFAERFGIDKLAGNGALPGDGSAPAPPGNAITLVHHDLEAEPALPFGTDSFDVVTMLAVFEHLEPAVLRRTLAEVRRTLRPGGVYVMTTPAAWTAGLLRIIARLGLVSAEEIDEHKDAYTHRRIAGFLEEAGFAREGMRFGSFECRMNLWATARK